MDTEDYHGYYQQGDAGMRDEIKEVISYVLIFITIAMVLSYLLFWVEGGV